MPADRYQVLMRSVGRGVYGQTHSIRLLRVLAAGIVLAAVEEVLRKAVDSTCCVAINAPESWSLGKCEYDRFPRYVSGDQAHSLNGPVGSNRAGRYRRCVQLPNRKGGGRGGFACAPLDPARDAA